MNYPRIIIHKICLCSDVGYDGIIPEVGFINNVLNMYFTEYFPRAARVGQALSDGGYVETFTYTTHPWLVSLYLDCPPHLILSGIQLKVSIFILDL